MKRQRTKCFTGCWTCRSRRVKCDEEVPSCRRCRQMGVACEGYGLRLSWVQYNPHDAGDPEHNTPGRESSDQPEPRASRRSLAAFGAFQSVTRLNSPELDTTLATLDEWQPGESSELESGAFSVFTVQPSTQNDRAGKDTDPEHLPGLAETTQPPGYYAQQEESQATHNISAQALDNFLEVSAHIDQSPPTVRSPSYYEQQELSVPHRHLDNFRAASTATARDPRFTRSPPHSFRQEHSAQPQRRDNIHEVSASLTQSLLLAGSPPHPSQRPGSIPPRHLNALSLPTNQKRLIHHWITFTSRKLILIDEPHNPCRTMMLPMALKGLLTPAASSTADVAIFHAVCASAAYNLFELSGRTNEQDRVLALYHDSEAVRHLRFNLARADEHRDQSFAMAIMACIAVEAVSGTTCRWRTHVAGGLAYLAQLQSQGLPEVALSAFRQHMVKMAILCGMSVPEHLKSFLDDESGVSDGLEFTFPYYGVSRSFLRAQDRINTLLVDGVADRTPEQEKDLDAFELQLYLDYPTLPPQSPLPATHSTNGVVIHHTSMAFYYAGLVFFQRNVRDTPIIAVQDLVELGLQELESIDRVGQGSLGCLMLWPVLVLGAECDGAERQQRMRAWFQAQRRLGFRNLVILEDLVATVWSAKADSSVEKAETDWRHVIAQAQFDVFRL